MNRNMPEGAKELSQPAGLATREATGEDGERRFTTALDEVVEAIAIVCHEANRAYCTVVMDDRSQLPWDAAPFWQRESARLGVRKILEGHITRPEQSHESWLAQKQADGWVYGAVKDADAKTHPCMVPYSALPRDQRRKDHLFFAITTALSADL